VSFTVLIVELGFETFAFLIVLPNCIVDWLFDIRSGLRRHKGCSLDDP